MTTPFFALLPSVAESVSATSSATLTCALLLRCPVQDLVFVVSFCRTLGLHVSHIALLPEVVFASAPVPICSTIWEVCFNVNTVLDDPPINPNGATRFRQCSLLGGATRTRSDAVTCVLLSDATRTRHDDAISGERLTVPRDSDFLCVSLIRDGLASQHTRSLTVLNTVSLVSSSAAQSVF